MRLRSLLLLSAVTVGLQASAQLNTWVRDSVQMTSGYANDVFYSLKTGAKKAQSSTDWHLGFQTLVFSEPAFNATIRANHAKGKVEVYSLHRGGADFISITSADTVGLTNPVLQQNNIDTSWGEGAFLQNRGTNPFDYGWGFYNMTDHSVYGDSVYLIKANGAAYKIIIDKYVSTGADIGYTFRFAEINSATIETVTIKRNSSAGDFTKRLFAYYNLTTKQLVDREPNREDWDLLFTQYVRAGYFNGGMLQPLTGVLVNVNTQVADVRAANLVPATADYSNYLSLFNRETNQIGDDWKSFDYVSSKYILPDTITYFVKTGRGEYYQIQFERFDGTSTGITVFDKRLVAYSTSVADVNKAVTAFAIVPNPATRGNANVMIDAQDAYQNAQLVVTDITGRIVQRNVVNVNKGLNGFSINTAALNAGTYIVTLTNGSWKSSDKLILQD
jgi:Secretion system C-terminal sorting domain/HmuY protein